MAVENKFWRSPDLVAQLMPFLDVASTLALATVQPLVVDLIQRRFIWKDLIRRSAISGVENEDSEEREKCGTTCGDLKVDRGPRATSPRVASNHLREVRFCHTIPGQCPCKLQSSPSWS